MKRKKPPDNKNNMIISSDLRETFNKVKVNIDFSTIDASSKVIVISSSIMGEGKTNIAINTAISMADAGSKTLLIDADMRKPKVHKLLGILNTKGLSEIFAYNEDWHLYINKVGIDNLHVISSGKQPPNPSELLGSQRMKSLIDNFREEYQYIIFDTPPILPVPDAISLTKHSDGIVLITRYGYSNIKALEQCRDALKLANAKIIGTVVNDMPVSNFGYGKYSYGYHIED